MSKEFRLNMSQNIFRRRDILKMSENNEIMVLTSNKETLLVLPIKKNRNRLERILFRIKLFFLENRLEYIYNY